MAKDKQEYDYEGDMAMSQLKSIIANAQRIHDMLSPDTNLPEWVQSKITLAEDYITTASNYLQGENVNESKNKPYVKPFSYAGSSTQAGGKASNKHGKLKFFGVDFKKSAEKHAGITTEEVAANAVGGGKIAGVGIGPQGEPGVTKTKYAKKNKAESPVIGDMVRRKSFKQFAGK